MTDRTARAIAQLRETKAGFKRKAEEAAQAPRYKTQGEALLQNQQAVWAAIKKGQMSVCVPDWSYFGSSDDAGSYFGSSDDAGSAALGGEPPLMEIELDPTLAPADNAKRYFQRFKKLSRQATHVQGLLDVTVGKMTELVRVQVCVCTDV